MTHDETVERVAQLVPHLAARFLSWKLPPDFHPDAGISFVPDYNNGTPQGGRHEPTGTNLLNAEQAFAMVRHLLDHPAFSAALSALPRADDALEGLRKLLDEHDKACGPTKYTPSTQRPAAMHMYELQRQTFAAMYAYVRARLAAQAGER